MYERSAIVLERYFEKLLGFNEESNLKQNFINYCDLFKKFNIFQEASEAEISALSDFQAAENTIEEIQASQEKLYKKNAKLEYNRDLIFSDITQKPEEIERCILKIESDIAKNQASLITLREKFIEAVRDYNEKKSSLAKCKKSRRNAESDYNSAFENTKQNLETIAEQFIEIAKGFATEENETELVSVMADNGKEEKIPFNNSVITSAAKLGFDILQKEAECYLLAYNMTKKIINELLEGAISIELHQKTIRNINVKLNFLNAEKEYLVQFLDYERITVIHGKRTHRTLMIEACEKFEIDVVQINNLYELLIKEIANKSTKKAYKELYNKSYLIDIEEKEAKFKKEKNKMNLPVGTIMNSNYWRIEGIKNIYTVFYKDISEVFGKDLVEFDMPKEQENYEEDLAEVNESVEIITENETVEVAQKVEEPELVQIAEEPEVVQVIEAEPEIVQEVPEIIETVEFEEEIQEVTEAVETIEEVAAEEPVVQEVEIVTEQEEIQETVETVEMLEAQEIEEIVEVAEVQTTKEPITETIEVIETEVIEEMIQEIEAAEQIEITEKRKKKSKMKVSKKVAKCEKIEELTEEPEECVIEEKESKKVFAFKKNEDKKKEKKAKKEKAKVEKIEIEVPEAETSLFEKTNEDEELFEEKYLDIEKKLAELDKFDEYSIDIEDMLEDTPYEDDDMLFEEESIFDDIENEDYEELSLKKTKKAKNKKSGILNKIIKLNSKEKKEVNN